MLNFDFFLPTRLLTGAGCVRANSHRLRELGKRCLIVTGRASARRSGALDDVTAALNSEGIIWRVFDEVEPNPLLSTCRRAGGLARGLGADFIVGIGGGSPLDAAKAAAVYASNDLELMDIYRLDWPVDGLPTVLVGTTAGTGSEVGPAAVLTKPDGHKQSVSREDLVPRLAFGDARYTASLPVDFTVSTALDALCHAAEGYFSLAANALSDLFALEAAAVLCRHLPGLREVSAPEQVSMETREELYYASVLAGLTLARCGTCYCHNLSYLLTEEYGVAHGAACAAFLPDFLRRAGSLLPEKSSAFYSRAGVAQEQLLELVDSLLEDLSHIRLSAETIAGTARAGAQTKNFARTAPAGYTAGEAEALLYGLFGGER